MEWTSTAGAPPLWWPDDRDAWERAAVRASVRTVDVQVEFDGLLVGFRQDGRVTRVDVLDPDDGLPRPALRWRVKVALAIVLVALVTAEVLGFDGAAFVAAFAAAYAVVMTFLHLGDERPVRRLRTEDAPVAVDLHAVLRRREQRRDADHVLGRRRLRDAHRLLWDLAGEAEETRAAELRARYGELAAEVQEEAAAERRPAG